MSVFDCYECTRNFNKDFYYLEKEQQELINSHISELMEYNRMKVRTEIRTYAKISKEELRKLLFERRELEGDLYVNSFALQNYFEELKEDKGYVSIDIDEELNIIVGRNERRKQEGKIIGKYTPEIFTVSCKNFPREIVWELCMQVEAINVVSFGFEEYEDKVNEGELLGYQTIEDFTFFGMWTGDPNFYSIFYIIYWDGNKLRAYVPVEGNTFNKERMRAYETSEVPFKYKSFAEGLDYKKIKEDIVKKFNIKGE